MVALVFVGGDRAERFAGILVLNQLVCEIYFNILFFNRFPIAYKKQGIPKVPCS